MSFLFQFISNCAKFCRWQHSCLLWKNNYGLIVSLESQCEVALNWFNENKMIVNPGKLQAIIKDKRKQDHINEIFKIGSKGINVVEHLK